MIAAACHVTEKEAMLCAVDGENVKQAVFTRCGDAELDGIDLVRSVARQVAARFKLAPPFPDAEAVWVRAELVGQPLPVTRMVGAVCAAIPSRISVKLTSHAKVGTVLDLDQELSFEECRAYEACRAMIDAG